MDARAGRVSGRDEQGPGPGGRSGGDRVGGGRDAPARTAGAAPGAEETDVLIVGAGPTGLALASELALAKVATTVVERLPEPVEQVKGGGIQPRTAELLEMRDLLEPLRRYAMPRAPSSNFALLPVPLDCSPWGTRHPRPLGVPQWRVEEVLQARAHACGARVRRGVAVASLSPAGHGEAEGCGPDGAARREAAGPRPAPDTGVVATTSDGRVFRARWLVACDGGRSTVRKLLGLPFPGRPGTYLAALADVRLSAVSPLVPRQADGAGGLVRRAGGYWSMLLPVGDDRYRFTFGSAEQAGVTRDTPVTTDEVAAALHAVYGPETVLSDVRNAGRFTDATRQLEQYRAGRVLFAGDAAHIHPPLGAQGLNLGIQDAFNLGWKLAATVRGRAAEGLLDSYHAERHPVAAQVLHHTSAQRVLADPRPSPDVEALRDIFIELMRLPDTNRHLAGLISGLSLRYDIPGGHPLTGRRVPDADLVTADGAATRLSALFRRGQAVLLDLAEAVPEGLRLPSGVEHVRAKGGEELGAAALLFRPDGYVCWAADDPDACRTELLPAIASHLFRD